jgi:hypothetical protein
MSTLKEKRQAKKELGVFFLLPIRCVDLHHFERILEEIFESQALATLCGSHQDRFSTKPRSRAKSQSFFSMPAFSPNVWRFSSVAATKAARFQKSLHLNLIIG